ITDTGCGLSPEVRRRIFAEPFFSTKPRHRGLGLAVVYGILRAHRGGIRVEQGAERGTVVHLYFPVVAHGAPPAPVLSAPAALPAQGERILVVDDEPLVLQLMCTTLAKAGYQAQGATD